MTCPNMSKWESADDERTIYPHDFVRFYPGDEAPEMVNGRVVRVEPKGRGNNPDKHQYAVQVYRENLGPSPAIYRVDAGNIELHPEGRMSLMDEINESEYNR